MTFRKSLPMLIGSTAILISLLIAGARQARPAWTAYQDTADVKVLTPTLTQKPELCLTCHEGVEQISESHPVDAFGCVVCHGGDRLSLDEAAAHASLIGREENPGNPADFSTVEVSCGGSDCHSGSAADQRDHIARAQRNLHNTYAGAVQEILAAQGVDLESGPHGFAAVTDDETATGLTEVLALPDDFPQLDLLIEECGACHVSNLEAASQPTMYRGTGCSSCHVLYTSDGLYQGGDPTLPTTEPGRMATHQLTVAIPSSTCTKCHYQGTYDAATLTFTPRADLSDPNAPIFGVDDPNHFLSYQEELDCIDCHTASEVMGDGDIYLAQEDVPRVECRTCHGTLEEPPEMVTLEDINDVAFRRAQLNPFYDVYYGNVVLAAPDGEVLGHTRVEGELVSLNSKTSSTTYLIPQVYGSACEQDSEKQSAEDCRECHDDDQNTN
jgi:hypothetical protein